MYLLVAIVWFTCKGCFAIFIETIVLLNTNCNLISFYFIYLVQVTVLFEIIYKSPDDEAGNFEPKNLIESIQRQHHQLSQEQYDHGIDDDQQTLLDIGQNIANLEKNLNRGKQKSMRSGTHINSTLFPYCFSLTFLFSISFRKCFFFSFAIIQFIFIHHCLFLEITFCLFHVNNSKKS